MTVALPRRAVIATAAAALVTLPVKAAAPSGDPVFATKRQELAHAWEALHALFNDSEAKIEALGPRPELPSRLREPLRLPREKAPCAAPADGWDAETLANIADTGLSFTAQNVKTANGATMRVEWKPVSAKTRVQAVELLNLRKAYDAECNTFWEKIRAIEDREIEPLRRFTDKALDLIKYPVFTAAEVREKLALVSEYDLDAIEEDRGAIWKSLIRDALAAAEMAHATA